MITVLQVLPAIFISLLSGLMANIGGPTQSRRRLMMAITDSILLYGSEIWADALRAESGLRILSSHRRISKSAILVISGVIPIALQASEQKRMWETKNVNEEIVNIDDARKRTTQHWQEKWNNETWGRWTEKLLPDITSWMGRKFGEVNYYLIQLLSWHGYFCKYLYKMGKMMRPNCIYGDASIDDAEHTFFHCERWVL